MITNLFRALMMLALVATVLKVNADSSTTFQVEKAACENTLYNYLTLRDKGPRQEYENLFTEKARFVVAKLNIDLNGRQEIGARLDKALATQHSTHSLLSVDLSPKELVSSSDDGRNHVWFAESHFLVHLTAKKQVDDATTQVINGRYVDRLVISEGHCYIDNRQVIIEHKDTIKK